MCYPPGARVATMRFWRSTQISGGFDVDIAVAMTMNNVTSLTYDINGVSVTDLLNSIDTSDDPVYSILLACDVSCIRIIFETVRRAA